MVFLFHLSGNVAQRQITFPASFSSFYGTSQRSHLIFLTLEQPQG